MASRDSGENGIHVFDFDSGEELASVPIPDVADIHWIGEDELVVGTRTGVWARISFRPDTLIDLARTGLTRGFTSEECETYRIDPCPSLEELRDAEFTVGHE